MSEIRGKLLDILQQRNTVTFEAQDTANGRRQFVVNSAQVGKACVIDTEVVIAIYMAAHLAGDYLDKFIFDALHAEALDTLSQLESLVTAPTPQIASPPLTFTETH